MSDATTVLLTLGPAIVTGAVGYSSARLQARSAFEHVAGELDRLRQEQHESERQRRLTSYLDFLTLVYRLDAMMAGFAPLSKEAFEGWLDSFQSLSAGIDLFGSEHVHASLSAVNEVLDQIGIRARHSRSSEPFEQKFAAAYFHRRADLADAMEAVAGEMRRDVTL